MDRMGKLFTWAGALALCLSAAATTRGAEPSQDKAQLDFFENKIRPVLIDKCYKCHSAEAKKLKGKLRLDNWAGMDKGGDSGKPAVVPGDPGGPSGGDRTAAALRGFANSRCPASRRAWRRCSTRRRPRRTPR